MKLLDTAVLVDIDRGEAGDRVEELDEEGRHAISLVSVTEMRIGVELQYEEERREEAIEKLERFLSRFTIIEPGRSIAVAAAEIVAELKQEGEPLNDLHDVYIAASAKTRDLPVLTPNTGHFDRISDVDVADWKAY